MRIVFHHYKESPYAEKIRTLLGYKQLSWQSVVVPRIAPKPDLEDLTGGYRKVPVLQMGADVFCDTRLIAHELDALAPSPSSSTAVGSLTPVLESWVDQHLFGRAVGFTFGSLVDYLPDELLADRAALRGAPLPRTALKAAVPLATQELRQQMPWLDNALADREFFNGSAPSAGDFTLYSTLWFAGNGGFDFSAYPRLNTWLQRMKSFGHGNRTDLSSAEALALAQRSVPRELPSTGVENDATGLQAGQHIKITPELLGHGTSVVGELVALNAARVVVRHQHERCGTVHVHLPRLGYVLKAID
jgi:glutathione S-transferase